MRYLGAANLSEHGVQDAAYGSDLALPYSKVGRMRRIKNPLTPLDSLLIHLSQCLVEL